MTRQQKVYYDAIKQFIDTHGCSPTFQQIANRVGVTSMCSVHRVVHRLIREGYLVQSPQKALYVVPDKLHGFNKCDRYHAVIYFQAELCPLCLEIQKHSPARQVTDAR